MRLWHLGVAGAVVGFLTGLVLSTGPLSVPMFTGYGLSGGAFLGSEAASACCFAQPSSPPLVKAAPSQRVSSLTGSRSGPR